MAPMSLIQSAHWQPALGADGIVEQLADIHQSIRIILTTPQGADPLRPEFACNLHRYLDWPLERARPHLVREAVAAVSRWEPRIALERVQVEQLAPHQLGLRVRWRWADQIQDTEVPL